MHSSPSFPLLRSISHPLTRNGCCAGTRSCRACLPIAGACRSSPAIYRQSSRGQRVFKLCNSSTPGEGWLSPSPVHSDLSTDNTRCRSQLYGHASDFSHLKISAGRTGSSSAGKRERMFPSEKLTVWLAWALALCTLRAWNNAVTLQSISGAGRGSVECISEKLGIYICRWVEEMIS